MPGTAKKQKSYAQMCAILARGESVTFNGRMITTQAELPSPAEVAQSDPAQADAMLVNLIAQQRENDRLIAALQQIQAAANEGNTTAVAPGFTPGENADTDPEDPEEDETVTEEE